MLTFNQNQRLAAAGFVVVPSLKDFVAARKLFDAIRFELGVPRSMNFLRCHREDPTINIVESTMKTTRKFGDQWHSDHAYESPPPAYTCLLGEIIPRSGGETALLNRINLAGKLPKYLTRYLEKHDFRLRPPQEAIAKAHQVGLKALPERKTTGIELVNGEPCVMISPYHVRIEDNEAHSGALIDLFTFFDKNKITVEWAENMILIWDNRTMFHKSVNNYEAQHRRMYRSIVDLG